MLLYIKSSLTGDEPADLQNYKREQSDFPHHSTADQFFDEKQFESYRHLGQLVMAQTLGELKAPLNNFSDLNQVVNQLTQFAEKQIQQSIVQHSVASLASTTIKARKASSKIKAVLKT